MKKEEKPSSINKKGAVVGLVICFVGAIAMVGTYTFKNYQKGMQQVAEADTKDKEQAEREKYEETKTTNADEIVLPEHKEAQEQDDTRTVVPEETDTKIQEAPAVAESSDNGMMNNAQVNFLETDSLSWPVEGNVVLNYSMDKTVYFATLDQYKYNPALIIGGQADAEVKAAARGIVQSIEVTAETGNTVTLDMGNGFQAVYGQLKEVPVQLGQLVEAEQLIGYLSEPTKYYSVEGCSLYFQLLKDGEPVNPMEHMES